MSRLSVNIHGLNVKDKNKLVERLKRLRPSAVLVLDNLDLSRRIKSELPETTVIHREYEKDKKIHQEFDPEAWLDSHVHQAEGGIVVHVGNEMGFDPAVLAWLLRVCKRAVEKNVCVCVGNWAVGNPQPEAWPLAIELLKFASAHPENVIVGLHEYAGGVITSGLFGGYPDNAGVAPGKPGGMNLIMPANWPQDLSKTTRYHMGRFQFLLNFCKNANLKPPRIIITEHGFDDTSDIKAWEDTLKKTPPFTTIRGWKTLQHQWGEWFGRLGWTPERAYAEQLIWADKTIYADTPIEAQCIYCYGHSSDDWIMFDTEDATEFWDLLVKYSQEAAPMPMIKPQNASDRTLMRLVDVPEGLNVRTGPGDLFAKVGLIPNEGTVQVYRTPPVSDNKGRKWYYVDIRDIAEPTWICEFEAGALIPVPVPTNGNPAPVPLPAPPPAPQPPDDEPPLVLPVVPIEIDEDEEPDTTPMEPTPEEKLLEREISAMTKIAESCNAISIELKRLSIASADYIDVLRERKEQIRKQRLNPAA